MIEFGKELRAAREAKGYSIAQVAEMTKMLPSIVEGLECENFTRIVAPIYGRGFVKLYCQTVGLEPKIYVDEFMDIMNGKRDDQIRERPVASAPRLEEPPPSEPQEVPPGEPAHATPAAADFLNSPAPESDDAFSRYATPIRQAHPEIASVRVWRIAILAALALGFLWLIILGFRALYSATGSPAANRSSEATQPGQAVTASAPAKSASDSANANRTPQKIPSLYLD